MRLAHLLLLLLSAYILGTVLIHTSSHPRRPKATSAPPRPQNAFRKVVSVMDSHNNPHPLLSRKTRADTVGIVFYLAEQNEASLRALERAALSVYECCQGQVVVMGRNLSALAVERLRLVDVGFYEIPEGPRSLSELHAFSFLHFTKVVLLPIPCIVEKDLSPVLDHVAAGELLEGQGVFLFSPQPHIWRELRPYVEQRLHSAAHTAQSLIRSAFSSQRVKSLEKGWVQKIESGVSLRNITASVVLYTETSSDAALSARLEHLYWKCVTLRNKNLLEKRTQSVKAQQAQIRGLLGSMIPTGVPLALVDWPDHPNCGDSAIWVGEELFLRSPQYAKNVKFKCTNFIRGKYRKTSHDCDYDQLRLALGENGVILSHGGGNVRNYPGRNEVAYYQWARLQLVQAFPGHQIIILPQSINFEKRFPGVLRETAAVWNAHPSLTLMCRDHRSLHVCKTNFPNITCVLSPDMALLIGMKAAAASPDCGILWIKRVDAESVFGKDSVDARILSRMRIRVTDWKFLKWERQSPSSLESYYYIMQGRVADGLKLIGASSVVITDRLHAMILGVLSGKPVVALDNDYGKLRGYFNAFLADAGMVRWASTEEEAVAMALETRNAFCATGE